ncbi:hypothetical protein ACRRTK_018744 [Alexandromys fortis]
MVYDVIVRTSEDAPPLLRDAIARQDLSKHGDCPVDHALVFRLISSCGAKELILFSFSSHRKTPSSVFIFGLIS